MTLARGDAPAPDQEALDAAERLTLGDLRAASSDETRFREYVYSLLDRCSRRGVSVMMTHEILELYGISKLTEHGASHLADNVVLLQYAGFDTADISRTLTVLKPGRLHLASHNPLLRAGYPGATGIKTGYTRAAGFNLVSSAQRGERRVLVSLFGGRSSASRNAEVIRESSRSM
jgi:hypothetical protein